MTLMKATMATLIIHHLETVWECGYRKLGTSMVDLCLKIREHIEDFDYDKVILTRFEDDELQDDHYETGLADYIDRVEIYGYGWGDEDRANSGHDNWTEGGAHSKYVYLAEWMKELDGDIHICGAFDFECIEDLQIALRALDKKFSRLEDLIV